MFDSMYNISFMKIHLKKVTIYFFLFFLFQTSIAQHRIDYNIFYSQNVENEGLKIQVKFKSKKAKDFTYFHYANEVWGETDLSKCIEFIKSDNPTYKFKIVPDSSRIVIYHPKARNIDFIYRLKQDYKTESIKALNRPRVKNNFFHVLGQSLFMVPEEIFEKENNPKVKATIEWIGFPDGFKIHNSFGTNSKKQIISTKIDGGFYHSLFIGGDYRIREFKHLNKSVYFAIRGNWLKDYQDEKIFEALRKTIKTQREFWNDNNFDFYTVIMTPTTTQTDSSFKGQTSKGSNIKNGFLIQSSNNPFNSFNVIKYMFNHEMMHDWIGGKIKMKNEELNYWFSEGFTDYYTYKNRLRNGDLSFQEWISSFNKNILKPYWKNPEKNKANYAIKDDFWKNRNIERIPYQRGAVFAFWLDNQILKKSNYKKSLDDLIREILKICETQNRKFTDELFLEISQKYLNEDISYFFQKHIIIGEDIILKDDDLIEDFNIYILENIPTVASKNNNAKGFIIN